MAAVKVQARQNVAPERHATPQNAPATNGKKKKNKKNKGKGSADWGVHEPFVPPISSDGDLDDLPPLEPLHTRSNVRSGLSPELESVHLSATASLSATAAARLNATAAAQAELLATATDLYRRMDADPLGMFTEADEFDNGGGDYLGSLPAHIRSFVQSAWASIAGIGNDEVKQRTMYAIAQQMVQSGVSLKNGTTGAGRGGGDERGVPGYPPGAYPPLPFDAAAFSDPAFTQALEHATRALNNLPPAPGQPPRGPLPSNGSMLGGEEYGYERDGYFSEDEVDEDVEDIEVEVDMSELERTTAALRRDGLFGAPGTLTRLNGTTHVPGDAKKKNKKKKKRAVAEPEPEPEPPAARLAVPTAAPPATAVAGKNVTQNVTVTTPHSKAMPAARTAVANPLPSSRAAGKQPMAYSPTTTTTTTTTAAPTNPTQARSARAASKAPLPPSSYGHTHPHHHPSPPSSNASIPQKHRPPGPTAQNPQPQKSNKIWSTNSSEERERIKEFWLGLGEEERRALVKVEKEAVLRKMKEQQKHSCSCAVCGRKRNAIEEELEVLYDAYYEELEQYANLQQQYASSGGALPPPPGPGPFPGSVELDKNGAVVGHGQPGGKTHSAHGPPRGKHPNPVTTNGRKKAPESEFDEDDPENDEYEEEYDEEEEEEEEEEVDDVEGEDDGDIRNRNARRAAPPPARARQPPVTNGTKANGREDLFSFGTGLTVAGPGNILTVADDLLKNDGQKFLEMMEQLAERRMQREEEAAADVEEDSEEEDDEEGDEEEEDEEEEDDEEDEEEEVMTEEQKMEEGKKMFSIFAARMFEQRVLQAYREKVAQERQLQLLRELEDEDKLTKEREAKKQKENQKKKDKKKQQKQAKEEEKASRAAEKAAEEAAAREKQRQLEEEQRKKREEERLKREAVRKALEEEKHRKEEERRKRIAEEKEREMERDRKRREKEEKIKLARKETEERERKAKEEREAKLAAERAEKAKKEQLEKEEREKKLAKEREEKAEREAKERLALQHQQQRAAQAKPQRSPTSPRNNAVASGSSAARQQSLPVQPTKKILNKPPPPVAPLTQAPRQPQPQPRSATLGPSQPTTPISPGSQTLHQSAQNNLSIATNPGYSPGGPNGPIPTPAMSPRTPFAPSPNFVGYAPPGPGPIGGGVPQQMQPQSAGLAPSALPRSFGGPQFDPSAGFGRGLAPAAPIGPPSKVGLPNPLTSPIAPLGSGMPPGPPGAPGVHRRLSTAAGEPGPGPITRPIAPIARPSGEPSVSSGSGSGAVSPTRRSPSPKGVLGSSALAAEDDEVVAPPSRRSAVAPHPVGQGWQSPRNSTMIGAPWGSPGGPGAPGPAYSSPRPMSGGGGLWGNLGANDWQHAQQQQQQQAFFGGQFVNHNPSPPPHSGN